jgi:hypothetical protein
MYGTAPAFSGGRGSYRADVRPAEMNRPDGQAGGVVHVFPNGTVLGHWSHIGGSGGPSPSRRATGTPALVYAESVMQHSPGLSALSGLPWVSGRSNRPNPVGVPQARSRVPREVAVAGVTRAHLRACPDGGVILHYTRLVQINCPPLGSSQWRRDFALRGASRSRRWTE